MSAFLSSQNPGLVNDFSANSIGPAPLRTVLNVVASALLAALRSNSNLQQRAHPWNDLLLLGIGVGKSADDLTALRTQRLVAVEVSGRSAGAGEKELERSLWTAGCICPKSKFWGAGYSADIQEISVRKLQANVSFPGCGEMLVMIWKPCFPGRNWKKSVHKDPPDISF